MTSTEAPSTEIEPNSPSDPTDANKASESPTTTESLIFKAVGIVRGEVNFSDDSHATVTINQKQYPLFYSRSRSALSGLRQEIEKTGLSTYRLIVYPKVTHFPNRNQSHQLSFQLVAFDVGRDSTGVFNELEDNQFKLSGLWQFIPVCRPPCISIFRNFTTKLLKYVHKMDTPAKKVRTLKASHLPVLWKDAPVKPFRFNPKADKDQGLPPFVQIKAVFLPHRDAFGFVELLAEPQQEAPRFLKARKEDKAQAQKSSSSKALKENKSRIKSKKSKKGKKSQVFSNPKKPS